MANRFSFVRKKYFKYLAIYSLLFICFFCVTYLSFILENRTFIWTSDGMGQYILNLYYLYTNIIDSVKNFFNNGHLSFPLFSFDVGIGNDILSMYFVGILEYLGLFLKRSNIVLTYNIISILKMYLTGISFLILCKYYLKKPIESILGSLIYVFSGYILYYGTRHPQFITPMILLPLFIISVDRLCRYNKVGMFIFLVFYSAWLDYYFLYVNSLIFGVYFLILNYTEKVNIKVFLKNIFNLMFNYFLGLGLAAIPFLTKVSDFLTSPRTTSTVTVDQLLSYSDNWLLTFVTRLFSPYINPDYLDHYMLYAVFSIVFVTAIALFFFKEKKYKLIKIAFVISLLFFFFPIFGFIFSGFSSTINRWSYSFLLIVSYIFVLILPRLKELNKKQWMIIVIATLMFCLLSFYEYFLFENLSTLIGSCCVSLIVILIVFSWNISQDNKKTKYIVLIVAMLINANVLGTYLYSEDYGKVASEFLKTDEFKEITNNSLDWVATKINDENFYRTELYTNAQHLAGLSKYFRYNGTSIYDSTNDEHIINYFRSIENIGNVTVGNYYNYDGRSYLEALASVKYFITPSYATQYVPYGFELYDSIQRSNSIDNIYINKNYMPIAFTYDNVISKEVYSKLSSIQKQEIMLQGIYLENYNGNLNILKQPNMTSEKLKYKIVSEDAEIDKNKIIAKKENSVLRLEFNADKNTEAYLNIEGLTIDSVSEHSFSILIQSNEDIRKGIWAMTENDFYKFDENNYLINLGYSPNGKTFCDIILPYAGEYSFDELNIYTQSVDKLDNYVEKLREDSLKNIEMNTNYIKGNLSLDSNKILCFSIPYNSNWELYIDGEKKEIINGNEMFISAEVESGDHLIELKYSPKAIKYGIPIMMGSFIILFLKFMYKKIKNENAS